MKKSVQGLCYLGILTLFLGLGISASAQNAPPAQQPDAQQSQPSNAQQPAQQDQSRPNQPPDQAAPPANDSAADSSQSANAQTFTGTVVKAKTGDKYMFQEDSTGKIYDIDHQDQVQKFEGKKVKVHGTLDPDTKTIHVQ